MKLCPRDLQIEFAVMRYWRRLKVRDLYGRRKHCSSCSDEQAWVLWGSECLLLPRYTWRNKCDAQRQSMYIWQGRMPSPHLGALRHSRSRASSWKPHGSSFSATAEWFSNSNREDDRTQLASSSWLSELALQNIYISQERKRFVKEGNCRISILFKINLLPCTVIYLFRDYFNSHGFPLLLH